MSTTNPPTPPFRTVIFTATFDETATDLEAVADALHDAALAACGGDGDDPDHVCAVQGASSYWVTHDPDDFVDVTHKVIPYSEMESS